MNMIRAMHPSKAVLALLALTVASATAAPVSTPLTAVGTGPREALASAPLSGLSAAADLATDQVTIIDIRGSVTRTITRAEIQALVPWMSLGPVGDGPSALAFSDSGRLLFIPLHPPPTPAAPPPHDGLASDAILRFDTQTNQLTRFTRLELSPLDSPGPGSALLHFRGRLYAGAIGQLRVYRALANDTAQTNPLFSVSTPTTPVGLAVDRAAGNLFTSWNGTLSRASITAANSLAFTTIGSLPSATSLAFSDHFGGSGQAGLYVLVSSSAATTSPIRFLSPSMALGQVAFNPSTYTTLTGPARSLTATGDGSLLIANDTQTQRLRDNADTRLGFEAFIADEFNQVVTFGRRLISPDGEPAGWVIDADVQQGGTRFHPATPDAACWTILLLLASDRVNADPLAQSQVRAVLQRYAGRSPDLIVPSRTADGIFRHWIGPTNGQAKAGWDPEFATLSTMKIVLAAARAAAYYPSDAEIQASARAIICNVRNLGSYFRQSDGAAYFKGLAAGGPDLGSPGGGWNEAVILAEQAGVYGGLNGAVATSRWLTRSQWASASNVSGRTTTTNSPGQFLPAFIPHYANLAIAYYRGDPAWQTNMVNTRLSHMAWTDDNGPRWNTVFAAGTTKPEWGGYRADSITDQVGSMATFPSLLAFAGMPGGDVNSAAGAYHAYRTGARQTFARGASILYRRSSVDPSYFPNSAGLPDVALGGLGLAELLSPGLIDSVLTGIYPTCSTCPVDFNADTFLNQEDLSAFLTAFLTEPTPAGPGGLAVGACRGEPSLYGVFGYQTDYNRDCTANQEDLSGYITEYLLQAEDPAGCVPG